VNRSGLLQKVAQGSERRTLDAVGSEARTDLHPMWRAVLGDTMSSWAKAGRSRYYFVHGRRSEKVATYDDVLAASPHMVAEIVDGDSDSFTQASIGAMAAPPVPSAKN